MRAAQNLTIPEVSNTADSLSDRRAASLRKDALGFGSIETSGTSSRREPLCIAGFSVAPNFPALTVLALCLSSASFFAPKAFGTHISRDSLQGALFPIKPCQSCPCQSCPCAPEFRRFQPLQLAGRRTTKSSTYPQTRTYPDSVQWNGFSSSFSPAGVSLVPFLRSFLSSR